MKVEILRKTDGADDLALIAARNDYFDGDICDLTLPEIMNGGSEYDLMRHLMMRGHWGPLEHAQFTIHFDCSRACMAQITRHRFISFDVQSMRYVNFAEAPMYLPSEHWNITDGVATQKTRQGVKKINVAEAERELRAAYDDSINHYNRLIAMGVHQEDARMVLPIATKVNVVASMNLRTAFHIISMRGAGDAQSEIRELAGHIERIVETVAPLAYRTWKDNRRAIERATLSP